MHRLPMPPVETRWKRASLLDEAHDDDKVVHGLSIEAAGNIKDDAIANQIMLFLNFNSKIPCSKNEGCLHSLLIL